VYCIAVSAGYTGLRVRVHTYPICVIMSIIIRPIVINWQTEQTYYNTISLAHVHYAHT